MLWQESNLQLSASDQTPIVLPSYTTQHDFIVMNHQDFAHICPGKIL